MRPALVRRARVRLGVLVATVAERADQSGPAALLHVRDLRVNVRLDASIAAGGSDDVGDVHVESPLERVRVEPNQVVEVIDLENGVVTTEAPARQLAQRAGGNVGEADRAVAECLRPPAS